MLVRLELNIKRWATIGETVALHPCFSSTFYLHPQKAERAENKCFIPQTVCKVKSERREEIESWLN
jgi:hypothetical protein